MSLILATPGTGDLIAKQGATNQWVFTLTTGGSPYDVSAFRIRMQIKRTPSLTAPADGRITDKGMAKAQAKGLLRAETAQRIKGRKPPKPEPPNKPKKP